MKKIIIATRASDLALWQAYHIKDKIENKFDVEVELNKITSKGDKILDKPLALVGGKGHFTKELEDEVYEMFKEAVKLEVSWGQYITEGQLLGLTDEIIDEYIKYLADQRLEAVGYEPLYNVSHPIPWVDAYASFNDHRTNFFEGNVINYSKGSISFDDF